MHLRALLIGEDKERWYWSAAKERWIWSAAMCDAAPLRLWCMLLTDNVTATTFCEHMHLLLVCIADKFRASIKPNKEKRLTLSSTYWLLAQTPDGDNDQDNSRRPRGGRYAAAKE